MNLAEFFDMHGLEVGSPVLNGEPQRVNSRNDPKKDKAWWYVGHAEPGKKRRVVVGSWRTGERHAWEESETCEPQRHAAPQTKSQQDDLAAKRRHLQDEAKAKALEMLDGSRRGDITHPYLEKKGIPPFDLALLGDLLLVVMTDLDRTIFGLQIIDKDGTKRFLKGQKTKGLCHVLGPKLGDEVIIAEGFATAASIYAATKIPTVAAFSAGNLETVAMDVRRRLPKTRILIAGDDDHGTEGNPGRAAAKAAADAVGAFVAFPSFKDTAAKGTDFNDLHAAQSLATVRDQIMSALAPAMSFKPLGMNEGAYLVFKEATRTVLRFSSFAPPEFLVLAPVEYWHALYPGRNGSVAWHTAASRLIESCEDVGNFDSAKLCGSGFWLDRNTLAVNTGKTTVRPLGEAAEFDNVYVSGAYQIDLTAKPLNLNECGTLVRVVEGFSWEHVKHAHYLLGWLVVARIAGALTVRPHIWLTGASGLGKSTLIRQIPRLYFWKTRKISVRI